MSQEQVRGRVLIDGTPVQEDVEICIYHSEGYDPNAWSGTIALEHWDNVWFAPMESTIELADGRQGRIVIVNARPDQKLIEFRGNGPLSPQ